MYPVSSFHCVIQGEIWSNGGKLRTKIEIRSVSTLSGKCFTAETWWTAWDADVSVECGNEHVVSQGYDNILDGLCFR